MHKENKSVKGEKDMYCQKCGKENQEGTAFCCGCGAPLSNNEETHQKSSSDELINMVVKQQKKKKRRRTIGLCILVAVVIFGVFASVYAPIMLRESQMEDASGNYVFTKYYKNGVWTQVTGGWKGLAKEFSNEVLGTNFNITDKMEVTKDSVTYNGKTFTPSEVQWKDYSFTIELNGKNFVFKYNGNDKTIIAHPEGDSDTQLYYEQK